MDHFRNKYVWIILPYLFTTGVLYLWAYWSSFNINIFQYANFTDLLRVSIIPVGSTFFFILIGFFLGEYASPRLSSGEGKNTKLGKFLNKTKLLWILLYWTFLIFLILSNNDNKWNIIPLVGMFFPYLLLKDSKFLEEIKSDSIRSLLIMSFCILPIFSFSQGKINANKILNNEDYKYVEVIADINNAKFLGFIGQYLFFISVENSKIILQKVTEKPLVLIQNEIMKKNK